MHGNDPRHGPRTVDPRGRIPMIPDWSVVTATVARQALEDMYVAANWEHRGSGLDPSSAQVLATVLRQYPELGRPPSLMELAIALGTSEHAVVGVLQQLQRHDLVLLDPATGAIQGAYPLTQKSTGHSITFRRTGRTLETMCAVDALGAGAMCREDIAIHAACRSCGTPIIGQVKDRGMSLETIDPRDTVVWVGLRESRGCAANSLCTELLFFCCDAHLDNWRAGHSSAGHRLSPEEAFQVGKALFIDRAMMGDRASGGTG